MEPWRVAEIIEMLVVVLGVGIVAYSPIARAIGNRILHGRTPPPGSRDDARLDDISGEVAALRQALYEQQERLDFSERLLTQARERGLLNAPRDG